MPIIEIWDNGNYISSDGCSSACQIEPGYTWTHQSVRVEVSTTSYILPVVSSSSIEIAKSQRLVVFVLTMLSQFINDNDISLSITCPSLPHLLIWLASYDNNQLIVSFSSTPIIMDAMIKF